MRGHQAIEVKQADVCVAKSCFCAPPITYLFGRLLARRKEPVFCRRQHAKRPASIEVFLRGGVAHALRGPVPDSAVLQQTLFAPTVGTYSSASAQLERLPSCRSDFGLALSPDCGTSASQQDRDSALQRIVSLAGRPQEVSRPHRLAPVSAQASSGSPHHAGPAFSHSSCYGYCSGALPADSITLGFFSRHTPSSILSRRTSNCQSSP